MLRRSKNAEVVIGSGPLPIAAPAKIGPWFNLFHAVIQIKDSSPYRRVSASLVRAHDASTASRTKPVLAPSKIARVEIFRRGTLSSTETQLEQLPLQVRWIERRKPRLTKRGNPLGSVAISRRW